MCAPSYKHLVKYQHVCHVTLVMHIIIVYAIYTCTTVLLQNILLTSSVPEIVIFKCPDKMTEQIQSTQRTDKNGQKLTIISDSAYGPSYAHMGSVAQPICVQYPCVHG